jgi:predicted transcriptional regulator
VRLDSGDANSWGRMQVVGELLVIFDETILFGLLALMTKYQSDAFETTQEELCRLADVQPTPTNYGAIWKSIQRLAGTRIDLELFSGKGRKRKDLKEMTGSILSYADINKETGSIRVVINPYFLEMYAASFVTNIDLKFRARLKSDVSKAFYRFYQGQYEGESDIDILRLARAVNLDTDLEIRRLKEKVRTGLKELEQNRYLEQYQITKDNRVIISKSKDSAAHFQSQILDSGEMSYLSE